MTTLLALFIFPLCAAVSGLVIWAIYRKEELEDTALLRNFAIVLALTVVTSRGITGTDAVQQRLHPELRMVALTEAHPLYRAIAALDPDKSKALRGALLQAQEDGATLPEAIRALRPLWQVLATERLGFADQATHVLWGEATVENLKELQRSPDACYQALAGRPLDAETVKLFSNANEAAFEAVVTQVFESALRGLRNERPANDQPADFNATSLEFQAIQTDIKQQFGADVGAQLRGKSFPDMPGAPPAELCAARIFELEAMLQRPRPTASLLLDSVLR